jgi:hypothetical protein
MYNSNILIFIEMWSFLLKSKSILLSSNVQITFELNKITLEGYLVFNKPT